MYALEQVKTVIVIESLDLVQKIGDPGQDTDN